MKSLLPERRELVMLTYEEWCKKEGLPRDEYSMAIYKHWKRSLPKLQNIIDDIARGYLSAAHNELGKFISAFRPERFFQVPKSDSKRLQEK